MANQDEFIQSHEGNFTHGRTGKIIRGFFHRTAITGDTAVGEGNYSSQHLVQASWYKVVDLNGVIVESVKATDTEWADNQWQENVMSLNYEFTGLNGSPLTPKQISAVVSDIKADLYTKGIAPHRLSQAEIKGEKVSGWGTHADITHAYSIAGGHMDSISESEIQEILDRKSVV